VRFRVYDTILLINREFIFNIDGNRFFLTFEFNGGVKFMLLAVNRQFEDSIDIFSEIALNGYLDD